MYAKMLGNSSILHVCWRLVHRSVWIQIDGSNWFDGLIKLVRKLFMFSLATLYDHIRRRHRGMKSPLQYFHTNVFKVQYTYLLMGHMCIFCGLIMLNAVMHLKSGVKVMTRLYTVGFLIHLH